MLASNRVKVERNGRDATKLAQDQRLKTAILSSEDAQYKCDISTYSKIFNTIQLRV